MTLLGISDNIYLVIMMMIIMMTLLGISDNIYLVIIMMTLECIDPDHYVSIIYWIYSKQRNGTGIHTATIWFQILVACSLAMYPFLISMT